MTGMINIEEIGVCVHSCICISWIWNHDGVVTGMHAPVKDYSVAGDERICAPCWRKSLKPNLTIFDRQQISITNRCTGCALARMESGVTLLRRSTFYEDPLDV